MYSIVYTVYSVCRILIKVYTVRTVHWVVWHYWHHMSPIQKSFTHTIQLYWDTTSPQYKRSFTHTVLVHSVKSLHYPNGTMDAFQFSLQTLLISLASPPKSSKQKKQCKVQSCKNVFLLTPTWYISNTPPGLCDTPNVWYCDTVSRTKESLEYTDRM